jgi:hypothetical protein
MAKKTDVIKAEELERMKIFEKASDSYKSIFTKDGLNIDGLTDLIENCLKLCDDDDKIEWTMRICMSTLIWGTRNYYEALGMMEACKEEYTYSFRDAVENED